MSDLSLLHSGYHHATLREWQVGKTISKSCLIYPIFVSDQDDLQEPIASLPGQFRWGINKLEGFFKPLVAKGLKSIMIFGVPKNITKDGRGSAADDPNGPVIRAIKLFREKFPEIVVTCDVCLCAYTSSGHCGLLHDDGSLDSPASSDRLAEVSLHYAQAGCHVLVPSDMMDGRVKAIKAKLLENKIAHKCSVMSMSSKYASSFYGPFRDACQTSSEFGNRKAYQLPPGSRGLAIKSTLRDHREGADFLLVKPMLPYLDMIRETSLLVPETPIATYQVSGEYAMLWHAAQAGVFTLKDGVMESLMGALRAGATILITYYTPDLLDWLD
ncbi:Aminolevulinate dehydratase [Entomophthora muscae]|uniref:Aminolevulinate dehydratase n=1 Tax=Entomophthora muscae TaxID=34485 RepID=A0ACC2TX71_9FUNG|nr:Aminolevulinate dehydratase [Entomophthora muscae]